jgi:uncharacterized membrane protein
MLTRFQPEDRIMQKAIIAGAFAIVLAAMASFAAGGAK